MKVVWLMDKIAIIAKISPVEIFRTTDTGMFGAAATSAEIKKDGLLRACVGFGVGPTEAIAALWSAMSTNRIIKDAARDERTEYAWNGRDWEIVRETGWAVVDGDGDLLSTIGFPSKRAALTDDTILVVWFDSEGDAGILANAIVAAGGEARAVRLDKTTLEDVDDADVR